MEFKWILIIIGIFVLLMFLHQGMPKDKEQAVVSVTTEAKDVVAITVEFFKNLWKGAVEPEIPINQTNITGG